MKLAFGVGLLVLCLAGCGNEGGSRSVTGPQPVTIATPVPTPTAVAVYTGTLSASSACAKQLPPELTVRVYEVKRFADGHLLWSGPTVIQPEGHQQFSSLTLDGTSASLVIAPLQDPQSDNFHGIWEELGGDQELNISGRGSGRVQGSVVSGTFEGDFSVWYVHGTGAYCHAADHRFTLNPR